MSTKPFVTVILCCRNEEDHIQGCVESLLDANYPSDRFEILAMDGDSDDGTRAILDGLAAKYKNVRWLPNDKRLKPFAVNKGVRESEGEVVVLCDAHADYPPGFVGRNVELLLDTGGDNVGGLTVTKSTGTVQADVVCCLFSHPLAIGDAHHRSDSAGDEIVEVESVFGGCYWRSKMETVGPFNEKLARTQDREYNIRLKNLGGRVFMDPRLKCGYYPRAELVAYVKWIFVAGYWLQYAWRFTDSKLVRWRNVIPSAFLLWHFVVAVLLFLDWRVAAVAAVPFVAYVLLALYVGLSVLRKGQRLAVALLVPPVLYATHLSYGLGAIWGLVKSRLQGKDLFDPERDSVSD
ncbi:MAG: glycosyltransferase family 2 protein [Armatimonadetes bacterium]|nr:glycosyltransferase family 2 protein [Armatimonadota bacterium]